MKPTTVNILGTVYRIEYKDRPSDVDGRKRDSLWGQIDFWDRIIRVYDNGRADTDIWDTIIHEILHGIANALRLKSLDDNENDISLLALGLADVFFRNDWIRKDD